MKLTDLNRITDPLQSSERMPVLFLGHGSPMNAIEENEFVAGFRKVAGEIPRPREAISHASRCPPCPMRTRTTT